MCVCGAIYITVMAMLCHLHCPMPMAIYMPILYGVSFSANYYYYIFFISKTKEAISPLVPSCGHISFNICGKIAAEQSFFKKK